MTGFSFAYFIILALTPVAVGHLVLLFSVGLLTSMVFMTFNPTMPDEPHVVFKFLGAAMTLVLGTAGILINQWLYANFRYLALAQIQLHREKARADREKNRANELLARALTRTVAEELTIHTGFQSSSAEVCTIECDIVGFSTHCEHAPATVVLHELERFNDAFEQSCVICQVEPLSTCGDAHIAVAGLNKKNSNRIPEIDCAISMLDFCSRMLPVGEMPEGSKSGIWSARVGIHSGPVMMAVMNGVRLRFDIWGETVNIAARLEQGSRPGTIRVSEKFLYATRGLFDYSPITEIQVKQTLVRSAELISIRAEYQGEDGRPNEAFWAVYNDPNRGIYYPNANGTLAPLTASASSLLSQK